jgi:hypothetical protein
MRLLGEVAVVAETAVGPAAAAVRLRTPGYQQTDSRFFAKIYLILLAIRNV